MSGVHFSRQQLALFCFYLGDYLQSVLNSVIVSAIVDIALLTAMGLICQTQRALEKNDFCSTLTKQTSLLLPSALLSKDISSKSNKIERFI